MANENLQKAKEAKNDELYTQLNDVAEELRHYKQHFKGKVVLCNCDDPTWSAFWKYIPWSKGGRTVDENLQMLCKKCNNEKMDK